MACVVLAFPPVDQGSERMATAITPVHGKDNQSRASARDPVWWAQAALITGLMLVLYAAVLADLANDWWTDPGLSQGLLIPPLALYIGWQRRRITLSTPAESQSRGLVLIGAACLLFLLGKLGAEFFLARVSFVVLLAGLVWTFWGQARLRTLTFPFLLLATMVPLPVIVYNAMAAPLQLFASDVATRLAQALGVTVYRDGNVIYLASLSLGVERACSGLNSLSALMVGSILLGFLNCTRARTRTALFLLSVPLSIAVNVVRVTGTAVLADYKQEFALGFYHTFSGWLVFLIGFAGLCGITKLLCSIFERKKAIA